MKPYYKQGGIEISEDYCRAAVELLRQPSFLVSTNKRRVVKWYRAGVPLGYKYAKIPCSECGKFVAENWILRHMRMYHPIKSSPVPTEQRHPITPPPRHVSHGWYEWGYAMGAPPDTSPRRAFWHNATRMRELGTAPIDEYCPHGRVDDRTEDGVIASVKAVLDNGTWVWVVELGIDKAGDV